MKEDKQPHELTNEELWTKLCADFRRMILEKRKQKGRKQT